MSKFLVTDPCYIVPDEDWSKFLDETSLGEELPEGGWKINGVGKIIEISGTDNGDGSVKIGKWEVGVDAGLVCIAEVSNTYKLPKHGLGALTSSREEAERWFEKACRI